MRVLIVCSSGGHLVQLHNLKPWWQRHDRKWVTFEKLDSKSLLSGAGVAFPFFLVARLLGQRTVYVEVYDRIDSATMTGRLCYPLSDLFLLQWEEQRHIYPKGIVIGSLL
jgi:beta-1,4-N-acetylglucosaminyltransferase